MVKRDKRYRSRERRYVVEERESGSLSADLISPVSQSILPSEPKSHVGLSSAARRLYQSLSLSLSLGLSLWSSLVTAEPNSNLKTASRPSATEKRACLGLPLIQHTEDCMPSDQDQTRSEKSKASPEAHVKEQSAFRPQSQRGDLNVLKTPLKQCCTSPLTGFERDGFCHTGPYDRGRHVVCAVMSEAFLNYTKSRGNDLSTPAPQYRFPGLKPGDRWCLCALRWAEAEQAGAAPKVDLEATHQQALQVITLEVLKRHAVD
jgi:uncharacterized protein